MEAEKDDYRKIAERRVRLGLLLSDIGQKNGVEVNQQEMNQLIMQAAQQYRPEDRQKFLEYVQQEPMAAAQLRAPLFEDKVVDYLFGTAEISEREVTREALQAAVEAEDTHVHGPGCGHDHGEKPKKAAKPAAKKAAPAKAKAAAPVKAGAAAEKPAEKAPAKKAPAKKTAAKKA
jgi:trigger factor